MKRLERIFALLDEDRDNVLNDKELTKFHEKCFGEQMIEEEVISIKNLLKKREKEDENLLDDQFHVTFEGFKYLVCRFLEKGKSEIAWRVFREYGIFFFFFLIFFFTFFSSIKFSFSFLLIFFKKKQGMMTC